MVTSGISKVKPAVIACGEKSGVKGQVKISVTVSPAGDVTNASVATSPDEALGACVANAVRKAAFTVTETGGSFTYPFVF
jgi:TonB family protein